MTLKTHSKSSQEYLNPCQYCWRSHCRGAVWHDAATTLDVASGTLEISVNVVTGVLWRSQQCQGDGVVCPVSRWKLTRSHLRFTLFCVSIFCRRIFGAFLVPKVTGRFDMFHSVTLKTQLEVSGTLNFLCRYCCEYCLSCLRVVWHACFVTQNFNSKSPEV